MMPPSASHDVYSLSVRLIRQKINQNHPKTIIKSNNRSISRRDDETVLIVRLDHKNKLA